MKPSSVAAALAVAAIAYAIFDQVRLEAQAGSAVVIREFRTRGPAGGNDEFIELFNAMRQNGFRAG